jgi:hypothetical protein
MNWVSSGIVTSSTNLAKLQVDDGSDVLPGVVVPCGVAVAPPDGEAVAMVVVAAEVAGGLLTSVS